jgi:hypothetical protein
MAFGMRTVQLFVAVTVFLLSGLFSTAIAHDFDGVTILIQGPFPAQGSQSWTMGTRIEVRGQNLEYHSRDSSWHGRLGGTTLDPDDPRNPSPMCNDVSMPLSQRRNTLSVNLNGSNLYLSFSRRIYGSGACAGTSSAEVETYDINLANQSCLFSYSVHAERRGDSPGNTSVTITDQPCAVIFPSKDDAKAPAVKREAEEDWGR